MTICIIIFTDYYVNNYVENIKKTIYRFPSKIIGIFRLYLSYDFNTFHIVFNILLKIKKYTICIFSQ